MTSLNSNQNQRDQEIAVQRKTECKINKRKPSVNSNKKKHVSVETKEVRKSCKLNSNLTGEKVMSTNENWGDPKVDGLKPQIMFDTLKSSYIVAPNIEKEVTDTMMSTSY